MSVAKTQGMDTDIKARMRERGIQQRDLARQLGVSDATVSQWLQALREGRHKRVPAERVTDLALALDVPRSVIRPDLWAS